MSAALEHAPVHAAPPGPDPWRCAVAGALPMWIGSRLALVVLTVVGAYVVRGADRAGAVPGFLDLWRERWDVGLFRKVAEHGYFSDAYTDLTEPFLPGMPLAMRLVHLVVPDWGAAGLVVSFLTGGVAVTALWRLAEEESGERVARRAVLYLLLYPYAVFLGAGYSESLFLMFAVTAWLAARHDRWWLAGLLAAGASSTRVTGLALGFGLGVHFLHTRLSATGTGLPRWRRVLVPQLPAVFLPLVPLVAYTVYLHSRTGSWTAYNDALVKGWGRDTVSPVQAFTTTLSQARNLDQGTPYLWSWGAEIAVMAVGVVVALALLAGRRFGEAAFVGGNVAMLCTSTYYASGTRALLVWFPAFLLLARRTERCEPVHQLLVWVSAPLAAGLALAFTQGVWLG